MTARTITARSGMNLRMREAVAGYLFLTPWLIGLLCFVIGPMIASAYFSFTNSDVVNTPKFVGLRNYEDIFTSDRLFWPAMFRTFRYAIIVVPSALIGSLLAAMLLNQALKGTIFFRTFFFMPHLTPIAASAVL